jgi:hydrogenase maturation protease
MMLFADIWKLFAEGACVVGVGNPMRGDDAAGTRIAKMLLASHPHAGEIVVDVEDVIEAYAFSIAKRTCKNVIIIDAVEAPAEAGTLFFGKYGDIAASSLDYSTHKMSMALSVEIIEQSGKTVYLLGIVPRTIEFGANMDESVVRASDAIYTYIVGLMNEYQREYAYER